ncbi:MAG: AAA family ATPase [Nitrosopumilaceae archaeon]|nr:AAA family ATPase [Nitrosopumilaceae archaeon]
MIDILQVKYKNFQSVGNAGLTIDLQKSPTTLLGGQNGAGKSTMLEAISYCLFGKTLKKVKLSGLINNINKKGMETEIVFRSYGDEYKVVRGEKPKKFKIYKNNELIDENAAAKDYQAKLERILGMDHKLFTQIVLLNRERYVPFMELSAADRRKVVEDILDINVFSFMNKSLKEKYANVSHSISDIEYELDIHKTKLDGVNAQIQQAHSNIEEQVQEHKDHIKYAQGLIDKCNELIADHKTKLVDETAVLKEYEQLSKKKEKMFDISRKFSEKMERLNKESSFYESNDDCPTCNQPIDDDFKASVVSTLDEKRDEIRDASGKLKTQAQDVVDALKAVNESITEINQIKDEIRKLERDNDYNQKSIKDHQDKINTLENKTIDDTLDDKKKELETNIAEYESQLKVLLQDKEEFDIIKGMLKDDGIKATIVDDYVGFINKRMNKYLNQMGYFINITLDGNFNEKINSINKEGFTYENLSTGQKTRVNLAIWLVLLEVSSMKNSAVTNLLFLDEILENLDKDGVSLFMNLIKEEFNHKNVFVVTQRFDEFQDYFRSEIYFKLGDDEFTAIV